MNAHNLKITTDLFVAITCKSKSSFRVPISLGIGIGDNLRFYEVSRGNYTGNCSRPFTVVNVIDKTHPPLQSWECEINFEPIPDKA